MLNNPPEFALLFPNKLVPCVVLLFPNKLFPVLLLENIEVVLLHDYNSITTSMLPELIEYLKNKTIIYVSHKNKKNYFSRVIYV